MPSHVVVVIIELPDLMARLVIAAKVTSWITRIETGANSLMHWGCELPDGPARRPINLYSSPPHTTPLRSVVAIVGC